MRHALDRTDIGDNGAGLQRTGDVRHDRTDDAVGAEGASRITQSSVGHRIDRGRGMVAVADGFSYAERARLVERRRRCARW